MIICGDAREQLDELYQQRGEFVHGVITSPPYWGLRDYSDAVECVFGGDEGCEHEWGPRNAKSVNPQRDHNGAGGFGDSRGEEEWRNGAGRNVSQGSFCQICGAWRGQFGLEPDPEMYVEHTLEFLRAIRRVLRPDGTVWWNLGDSYNSVGGHTTAGGSTSCRQGRSNLSEQMKVKGQNAPGLKPKDLVGIPFRFFLAAQADGWWMRSVVIWSKLNPMPEAVRDRPTVSHEYVFLMTKSGTPKYWTHRDLDGVRAKPKADYRWVNQLVDTEVDYAPDDWKKIVNCPDCDGGIITYSKMGVSWGDKCERCDGKGEFQLWKRINLWQGHDYFYDADAIREPQSEHTLHCFKDGIRPVNPKKLKHPDEIAPGKTKQAMHNQPWRADVGGRNKRTVWTIATQPYPEAHFATFPEALVEPMILTTPTKCCAECGAGWERITIAEGGTIGKAWHDHKEDLVTGQGSIPEAKGGHGYTRRDLGFRPTCSCDAGTKPAVVVDCFAGKGTVGRKARQHNRDYVLIEMNPDYIPMMERYLAMADEEVEKQGETWVQERLITV